ncbi:hypothetical protein VOLCADRAFT_119517, partial [Volvox carteri f. nagariensis]
MSLHGTKASFDPLSAAGEASDETFTTVYDSTSQLAPPPSEAVGAAAPAAAVGVGMGAPAWEYDSFMTARSAMSYMTSSHGVTTSAMSSQPQPPSSTFPCLAERPVVQGPPPGPSGGGVVDPYDPFLASAGAPPPPPPLPPMHPPPQLSKQHHTAGLLDDSNPFTAAVGPPYQQSTTAVAGPLSFGEDADGPGVAQTAAAFAMPLDLYDTPDAFMRPNAAAPPAVGVAAPPPPPPAGPATASAAAAPPLPPLYDFTREFSRMLLVSEDPASPVDGGGSAWYDNGQLSGASVSATAGTSAAVPAAPGSFSGPDAAVRGTGAGATLASYTAAALLTNTVSVHSPRKALAPSRIPGLSEPYIMYRITSRSAVSPETTVERRFRDVVALAELLQSSYPGCFVPPRPSRNAVEGRRMQPAFIEERRAGMEKFLRRLVVHPVLGPSEVTQVWLHSPRPDLRLAPEWVRLLPSGPPGLAKSTARLLFQRGDMYRLVRERTAQMRGILAREQPTAVEVQLREEAAALQ